MNWDELREVIVPAKTLTKVFSLSLARVGQLVKEGVIERLDNGRYRLAVIPSYIEFARKGENSKGIEAERERLVKAQADKLERENREADGLVAPIDVLSGALGKVLSQQVAIFEAIPNNVKRASPAITAREIEIIKKEVAKARNLAANVKI